MNKMKIITCELEEFVVMPSSSKDTMFSADHPTYIECDKSVDKQPLGISQQSVLHKPTGLEISPGIAEYTHWPRNVTIRLIEEYKENHKKVGVSIRNFKKLFEMIAAVLNKAFNLNLTGAQVNNKYKTLERGYKNVIDNNNKTGRGRKYFEYEKEMDTIYEKLAKINPELLLSETNIVNIPSCLQQDTPELFSMSTSANSLQKKSKDTINECSSHSKEHFKKFRTKKTRNDVLELIRQDRLEYHKKQISIATEKLANEREKLKEQRRRNDLLNEKNQLLKRYLQN